MSLKTIFKNKTNKIKSIIGDMMLNIIASILPIIVLQFVLLPIVAKRYDEY